MGRFYFCIVIFFFLTGCQSVSLMESFTKPLGPTGVALQHLMSGSKAPVPTSGHFEYLHVEIKSVQVLLSLGRRSRDDNNVVIEHWYSGQSELLELRNGRIWRLSGAMTEWRAQVSSAPKWSTLTHGGQVTWKRQLDIMPGYRYGQIDHIASQTLPTPRSSAKQFLALASKPQQLRWFSDYIISRDETGQPWIFEQVFAIESGVDHPDGRWIYSEQCVSPQMCMKLRYLGFVR